MKTLVEFGKADLHIHSNFSDGKMSVEKILEYAENKTDLDIIAITDHDTIAGAKLAQKIAEKRKLRVKVIIGEEISCQEGHLLALFIHKKIPPKLSVEKTLMLIKKQGGFAIAPHPLSHVRFQKKGIITIDGIGFVALVKYADKLQAIETLNASPILGKQNRKIQIFNKSFLFKPETAGSDAHIVEGIGMGFTAFEGKSIASLKKAIINNQTVAFSKDWKITTLAKYAFMSMPTGTKLFLHTLIHGRVKKRKMEFEKAKILLAHPLTDKKTKLSVIIPAFNEEKTLPLCLGSLKKQKFKGNYEIIVVNNNSTDGTAKVARSFGARIVSESKKGVCYARQTGILQAKSDIIVSTDADSTFSSDWLENIYQTFHKNPQTAAVFGPFEYESKPRWGRLYSILLFGTVGYFYFHRQKLIYGAASNMAFRRSAWAEAGGYKASLAQGGDEIDLLKRLEDEGGQVVFMPKNKVQTSSRRLHKGLFYNIFVSLIIYYIVDYYIIARLTGRTLFGHWPDFRDSLVPQKRSWLLTSAYILVIAFLSLSFIFGTGKVYATGRMVSGGKKVLAVTKDTYQDFRNR